MGHFLRRSWIWWVSAALSTTLLTWLLNWWRHRGETAGAASNESELRAGRGLVDTHAARISLAGRPVPLPPLDLVAAAAVIGSPVKMDDLEVVEGIGPKISELISGNGITTWSSLARTDASHLRKILDDGGSSFRVADPESWPHQAALLSNGRWTEFKTLTDELVAGRNVTGDGGAGADVAGFVAVPAEPPVPTAEQLQEGSAIVGTKLVLDDLKVVEGIGPAIEGLLNGGGISTWRQLEAAPADRLVAILKAAGSRFAMHDPATWPRQAGLLADAKWVEFKALTDELDGGRAV